MGFFSWVKDKIKKVYKAGKSIVKKTVSVAGKIAKTAQTVAGSIFGRGMETPPASGPVNKAAAAGTQLIDGVDNKHLLIGAAAVLGAIVILKR